MPRPLPPDLVEPGHTALVVSECMNNIVGPVSRLPDLAATARDDALPNVARLIDVAHAVGVPVVHCTVRFRDDGAGANRNAPLFGRGPRWVEGPGVPSAEDAPPLDSALDPAAVIDELRPTDADFVLERVHGIGPMGGTELDGVLRNLGATTVVATGVSVNVAVTNLAMDAVNHGYDVVLPRDAVAGIPREYAEAMIRHTLSFLTSVTTTDDVVAAWSAAPGPA
jgi:nicotinamidase-related amidase